MSKIKAVIFDWGGVLIDDPASSIISFCCKALKVEKNIYLANLKKYLPEFQRGAILENTFWQKLCAALEVDPPDNDSLWGDAFKQAYCPKTGMFNLVSDLQESGYKTGFISNTEIPAVEFFKRQHYTQFEVLTFSCIEHRLKPEFDIYTKTLYRLGCNPDEAVFIDDTEEYVEAAANLGIHAIQFKSIEDVVETLNALSVQWR